MKKMIAVLLALLLSLTAVAGLAEEITELNWESFEETYADQGELVLLEKYGMAVFIPAGFTQVEYPGLDYAFVAADGEHGMMVKLDETEAADLDTLSALLATVGAEEIQQILVNGIPALDFNVDNTANLVFLADGQYLQFVWSPIDESDFTGVAAAMAASIQVVSE